MNNETKRIDLVPGILTLRKNCNQIPFFSYGQVGLPGNAELDAYPCQAEFVLTSEQALAPPATARGYHFYWYDPESKVVGYNRKLAPGLHARLNLEGNPAKGNFTLKANAGYSRLIRTKVNKLIAPGAHLTSAVAVNLLAKGFATVHGACVGFEGKSYLIMAPPNTGKTYSSVQLILKRGFRFIGEDLVVYDGSNFVSVPNTATIRHYPELVKSKKLAMTTKLGDAIPPLAPFFADSHPAFELLKDHWEPRLPVGGIIFLAQGPKATQALDQPDAARELWNHNRYEFDYYQNPLLRTLEYFEPEFNLDDSLNRERKLLGQLVQTGANFRITAPTASEYPELIATVLGAK